MSTKSVFEKNAAKIHRSYVPLCGYSDHRCGTLIKINWHHVTCWSMCQKSFNFVNVFACYKQKCKLAPFNLAHDVRHYFVLLTPAHTMTIIDKITTFCNDVNKTRTSVKLLAINILSYVINNVGLWIKSTAGLETFVKWT